MESNNSFIIYNNPNGEVKVDVFVENETVWLTRKSMSELFGVTKSTISEHLNNIFSDNELVESSVVRKFRTTAADGNNYNTNYYNLDAIISVGYRVNSAKATQFRIWATQTLKEYIIKGFILDDARLKQDQTIFGKDYFKELFAKGTFYPCQRTENISTGYRYFCGM